MRPSLWRFVPRPVMMAYECWIEGPIGRLACRFGWHNVTCRGRPGCAHPLNRRGRHV